MIDNHFKPREYYRDVNSVYEDASEDCARIEEKALPNIARNPGKIMRTCYQRGLKFVVLESTLYGDTDAARRYLRCAQEASTAYFQVIMNHQKEIQLAYDGRVFTVLGRYNNFRSDAGSWLDAFYLAIIMRNQWAIKSLSQVSDEVFVHDEQGSDDFDNQLAALYQAMFNPDANFAEQMVRATAAFNPDDFTKARFRYVSRILWPQIAIIRNIFTQGQEAEFNQAMEKALLLHKEQWLQKSTTAAEGVIPMHLVALAVVAREHAGYTLTVENEYIPEWMVAPQQIPAEVQATYEQVAEQGLSVSGIPIPKAVSEALMDYDANAIESLREKDHSAYLDKLLRLYEETEDWQVREGLVFLLQDRRSDQRLKPMMESALDSPYAPSRGVALVWLLGPDSWEKVLGGPKGFDEENIAVLISDYRKSKNE